MAHEFRARDCYEDPGCPAFLQANAFCEGFLGQLTGIGHEQSVELPHDGALRFAKHGSIASVSSPDGQLHVA